MRRLIADLRKAYSTGGWTVSRSSTDDRLTTAHSATARSIAAEIRPDNAVVIGVRNGASAATLRIPGPLVSEVEHERALALLDLYLATGRVERTTPNGVANGQAVGGRAWRWS